VYRYRRHLTRGDRICAVLADHLRTARQDCLPALVITVRTGTTLDDCCRLMEARQIRRIPVVDGNGVICGIVSQADIARRSSRSQTAEVVKEISERPLRLPRRSRIPIRGRCRPYPFRRRPRNRITALAAEKGCKS
jgi:CBS domain